MNQISEKTIVYRSESLISNNLGEDVVMMDIENGSYYGLESVSASIWKLTESPVSVGSICDKLVDEYDVSLDKCRQEVVTFLNDLIERNIVEIQT